MDSNSIGLDLFKKVMAEARHNETLLDSYSPNQFISKEKLIDMIEVLDVINENSEIVIFGSWYGSILIPAFKYVKNITAIDLDEEVINIGKNRLFDKYDNVNWRSHDVFDGNKLDFYRTADLFINTSCEHMPSMKDWPLWEWVNRKKSPYFAFQSNNMFDIPTHTNCVHTLEEFKSQLPANAKVLIEDEIEDTRGIRFTLVGQICTEQL